MRSRLMLGALYVLLAVVVGLTVPFGATLGRRLTEELGNRVEREAFAVGAAVEDFLEAGRGADAGPVVERLARRIGGRVLLTDADGILLADSLEAPGSNAPSYASRPEIGEALRGLPNWSVRSSTTLGYDILVSATPVRSGGRILGVVRVSYPMTEVRAAIRRSYLFLALVGGVSLAIGMGLAAWLAGWITGPLKVAAAVARKIAGGELSARVPERGPPEVAELAADLNLMTARLAGLVRANREFAANASHQLRTPLAALRLSLEEAVEGPDPRTEARYALDQADRLSDIVDSLLALGSRGERSARPIDAAAVARTVAEALDGVAIEVEGAGVVVADQERLREVLTNLLNNATRFGRSRIRVAVEARGDRVVIQVDDDGSGIPPAERARVFDRFWRGSAPHGRGSGLGLAVARELAMADGATISVGDSDLGGARFEVSYPEGSLLAQGAPT